MGVTDSMLTSALSAIVRAPIDELPNGAKRGVLMTLRERAFVETVLQQLIDERNEPPAGEVERDDPKHPDNWQPPAPVAIEVRELDPAAVQAIFALLVSEDGSIDYVTPSRGDAPAAGVEVRESALPDGDAVADGIMRVAERLVQAWAEEWGRANGPRAAAPPRLLPVDAPVNVLYRQLQAEVRALAARAEFAERRVEGMAERIDRARTMCTATTGDETAPELESALARLIDNVVQLRRDVTASKADTEDAALFRLWIDEASRRPARLANALAGCIYPEHYRQVLRRLHAMPGGVPGVLMRRSS